MLLMERVQYVFERTHVTSPKQKKYREPSVIIKKTVIYINDLNVKQSKTKIGSCFLKWPSSMYASFDISPCASNNIFTSTSSPPTQHGVGVLGKTYQRLCLYTLPGCCPNH